MGHADLIGLHLNRHWIIHYERAGIPPDQGAAFVGRVLRLVGAYARRHNNKIAAIWVRENGEAKGAHAHILLHVPAGLTLRNRIGGWIKAAGGTYQRRVSKVHSIGGRLGLETSNPEKYAANLAEVLDYVVKGHEAEAHDRLALERQEPGGRVIGKRCGVSQNIGPSARKSALG